VILQYHWHKFKEYAHIDHKINNISKFNMSRLNLWLFYTFLDEEHEIDTWLCFHPINIHILNLSRSILAIIMQLTSNIYVYNNTLVALAQIIYFLFLFFFKKKKYFMSKFWKINEDVKVARLECKPCPTK
jgi:hypothetical protein